MCASGAGEGCSSGHPRRQGAQRNVEWRLQEHAPAWPSPGQAAGVFPGVSGRAGIEGSWGEWDSYVHKKLGRDGRDKSCDGPWAAELLSQPEPGPLERALGLATSKRSNCTITLEGPS